MGDYHNDFKRMKKILMDVELEPEQGDRFQPTGFPNLGAAVYVSADSDKKRNLIVESAQSMANRLEAVMIKGDGPDVLYELKGLSYVVVQLKAKGSGQGVLTSSLIEAHRLASPYIIKNEDFKNEFVKKAEYEKGKPIKWDKAAKAVFYYDVNSLVHGVFFSLLEDGRLRFPRVLSAFIEAHDVSEAISGGVKFNKYDPSGEYVIPGKDKNIYSNVPYTRVEYTAKEIIGYFNVDVEMIRSYNLDVDAENLILDLSLYKIRKFLETGLRLRTACNLKIKRGLKVDLPDMNEILDNIGTEIDKCRTKNLIPDDAPIRIDTQVEFKPKKENEGQRSNLEEEDDSDQD